MRSFLRKTGPLILDYCLGRTSREQSVHIEAFIARSEQAAEIHARIQAALEPLKSLHPEPCPAELAERTIRLLCATAQGSREASGMKIVRSSLRQQEDRQQGPGEFDTYDTRKTAIMELSPEGTG